MIMLCFSTNPFLRATLDWLIHIMKYTVYFENKSYTMSQGMGTKFLS